MEKKQKKNIDISVQEPEEIFHPDYVASQQKKKKRFRGMLGHWFGLFLVIIISIVIFYCLSNMVHILKAVRTLVKLDAGHIWSGDRIPAESADGILRQCILPPVWKKDSGGRGAACGTLSEVFQGDQPDPGDDNRSADHYRAALDADPAGV